MSIEETRKRRAEQQAQARQQKLTAAAPEQAEPQDQPTDLAAIRAAVHEAVAAELEEAQANQSAPLKTGLQRIYTELGEMRALLQILISALQAQAAERQEDEEATPIYEEEEAYEEPPTPQPRREPKAYILGNYSVGESHREVRQ